MIAANNSHQSRRSAITTAALAVLVCVPSAYAQPEPQAPKIVRTVPANEATDVDPATSEIVVEFDQNMQKGLSWCGGGPSYPKTTGPAFWRTPRVCVLPVKLEPDREYTLGINSRSFRNFRSKAGIPVKPSPLSFRTGSARSGVDLLKRYPTNLTAGDTDSKRARSWRFTTGDIFEISKFTFSVGNTLRVRTGPADVGIGHCKDGAVWAVVIPRTSGRLNSSAAKKSEKVSHVWLRMHPREITSLFPKETVRGAGNQDLLRQMRNVANHKMRASWQAGGRAMIPSPTDLTVDVDTQDGPRRFFMVDRDAGTAEYASAFERQPVPRAP